MVRGVEEAAGLFFLLGGAAARAMTGLTGPRPRGRRVLMCLPVKGGFRWCISEGLESKWWGKTTKDEEGCGVIIVVVVAWRSRRLDHLDATPTTTPTPTGRLRPFHAFGKPWRCQSAVVPVVSYGPEAAPCFAITEANIHHLTRLGPHSNP